MLQRLGQWQQTTKSKHWILGLQILLCTICGTGYSWSSLNSPLGLLDSIGRLDLSLNMEVEPQMLSTLLAIHILIDTHG